LNPHTTYENSGHTANCNKVPTLLLLIYHSSLSPKTLTMAISATVFFHTHHTIHHFFFQINKIAMLLMLIIY